MQGTLPGTRTSPSTAPRIRRLRSGISTGIRGEPNGLAGDILPQKLITETNFDWERCGAENPDAAKALHADPDAMYRHVINHGYAEGQKGYSRDDSENARLLLCETAHRIASDAMSDRDKIRAVHDWIVVNPRYDVENCDRGTIPYDDCSYSSVMLRRTGVCEGYASAFQYFMWVLDIPCGVVSSADHAWNKVRLGGTWYCIDVTWDDPVPDEGDRVYWYRYFLNTDPTFGGDPGHVVLRNEKALWQRYE